MTDLLSHRSGQGAIIGKLDAAFPNSQTPLRPYSARTLPTNSAKGNADKQKTKNNDKSDSTNYPADDFPDAVR